MDQGNQFPNLKTEAPNDDQCFLLYFIMGTYFGPDIKGERTKKSVLQRVSEGLPPYSCDQLTSSFIKVAELERIYSYILRNAADQSLTLKSPFLNRFFQGLDGAANCNYPQFPDLFPPELHPQSLFKNKFKIVHNIVFINNPETSYLEQGDVERFKRLSGVGDGDFHVDREAARLQTCFNDTVLRNMSVGKAEHDNNGNMPLPLPLPSFQSCSQNERKSGDFYEPQGQLPHAHAVAPISSVPCSNGYTYMSPPEDETDDPDKVGPGPATLVLPSRPTRKEWSDIVAATKNGFALTGSAAMGRVGPIVGLVDIGESEDSYLFRMSLPGVKRDESKFPFKS